MQFDRIPPGTAEDISGDFLTKVNSGTWTDTGAVELLTAHHATAQDRVFVRKAFFPVTEAGAGTLLALAAIRFSAAGEHPPNSQANTLYGEVARSFVGEKHDFRAESSHNVTKNCRGLDRIHSGKMELKTACPVEIRTTLSTAGRQKRFPLIMIPP